jgi:hypothetical protein
MTTLLTVGAFVAAASAPGLASAQIFDDTVSTCTGANCSSVRIPATVFAFGASAGVFTIDAFASPGECVRFDLISPPHPSPDMELVVVSPDGQVFRNDDRNGATDRRPLVKIGSAPVNGWYTVHVAQFAGTATETNITLMYGRYPGGNANCAAPTSPSGQGFAAEEETDDSNKSDEPAPPPRRGQPGSPE